MTSPWFNVIWRDFELFNDRGFTNVAIWEWTRYQRKTLPYCIEGHANLMHNIIAQHCRKVKVEIKLLPRWRGLGNDCHCSVLTKCQFSGDNLLHLGLRWWVWKSRCFGRWDWHQIWCPSIYGQGCLHCLDAWDPTEHQCGRHQAVTNQGVESTSAPLLSTRGTRDSQFPAARSL